MAVNFYNGLSILLDDLRRAGFHPFVLKRSGESKALAAEIAVEGGLIIHWDRESCSLWTEGPWPQAKRLEARLRRRYEGSVAGRIAKQPKVIASILAASAVLVGSYLFSDFARRPTPELVRSPAMADVKVSSSLRSK